MNWEERDACSIDRTPGGISLPGASLLVAEKTGACGFDKQPGMIF